MKKEAKILLGAVVFFGGLLVVINNLEKTPKTTQKPVPTYGISSAVNQSIRAHDSLNRAKNSMHDYETYSEY